MNKFLISIFIMILFFLVGCSGSTKYNDEDVAAIVREEEITIGELRFLYPDGELLNMIDGTIKAKLVVQEAKKMNIDVSEESEEMIIALGEYPPEHIETQVAKSIRDFVEPQAKKLGLTPEEYYKKYNEITSETSIYVNAYIQEILGDPNNNIEKYDERANEHLNELGGKNQDEITVLIKN